MAGNFYASKPEVGIYDASYGLLLKGDGKGNFNSVSSQNSGISVKGEVRNLIYLNSKKGKLVFLLNNGAPAVYEKK